MKNLTLWMRIVGGFYLLLGLFNTPPVIAARMNLHYPTLELGLDHVAVKAINDLWFMFGLEVAVIGLMLLIGSAVPLQNKILVQTVLLLELVRGIFVDVYWIGRGYYVAAPYIIWIVLHLAIIVSGWYFLRQADTRSEVAIEASSWQPS